MSAHVHITGNLQQYQAMPAEAQLQAQHVTPTIRDNPGTTRVVVRDGVQSTEAMSSGDTARSGEASPFHGVEGLFGTARNANGTPVMTIGDDTLLTLPDGMQASAKMLAAAGVITRNPDGTYSEAAQGNPEPEARGEDVFDMHPDNVAAINAALGGIEGTNATALSAAFIGEATGRLGQGALARKFGELTGLQGEEAQQRLSVVTGIMSGEAAHHLATRFGVDKGDHEAFFDWARANRREALADAIGKQIHGRDLSGYRKLAQEWMATTPPGVEALKAAGIPVRRSSHKAGAVEIYVRGSWMSPEGAARAGLL